MIAAVPACNDLIIGERRPSNGFEGDPDTFSRDDTTSCNGGAVTCAYATNNLPMDTDAILLATCKFHADNRTHDQAEPGQGEPVVAPPGKAATWLGVSHWP